jgi:hypothetical protein
LANAHNGDRVVSGDIHVNEHEKKYVNGRAEFDGIALDYVTMGDPSAPGTESSHRSTPRNGKAGMGS